MWPMWDPTERMLEALRGKRQAGRHDARMARGRPKWMAKEEQPTRGQRRRDAAARSRRLAEMVEGVPRRSDGSGGFGFGGPFSPGRTGALFVIAERNTRRARRERAMDEAEDRAARRRKGRR